MIEPHLVIMLSPSKKEMQLQTELLLNSFEQLGNIKKYFTTLVIPEDQNITNNYLLNKNIKIHKYKENNNPRWHIEAESELLLFIDSDTIICKDFTNTVKYLFNLNSFAATLAASSPFSQNSYNTWKKIYKCSNLDFPDILYPYRKYQNNISSYDQNCLCPFYPNCGFISLPTIYLNEIKIAVKECLKIINKIEPNNYYLPQIVCSLAVSLSKIPFTILDNNYNCLESLDTPNNETILYHYNLTRDSLIDKFYFINTNNYFLRNKINKIKW